MPTRAALRTEPTPSTMVQKMTGWIIILISATNAWPSGLSSTAKVGATQPDGDAGADGADDGEVEVVGAVPAGPRACWAVAPRLKWLLMVDLLGMPADPACLRLSRRR